MYQNFEFFKSSAFGLGFKNIPDDVRIRRGGGVIGKRVQVNKFRELPDMMSASEGVGSRSRESGHILIVKSEPCT